jgi:hypothetical protein
MSHLELHILLYHPSVNGRDSLVDLILGLDISISSLKLSFSLLKISS